MGVEDLWLQGVVHYLSGGEDRIYELGSGETALAKEAIKLSRLEWATKDVSVRLPGRSGKAPTRGPYR